jgi:hypothetical protein
LYALGRGLNTPLCSSASDLYRRQTLVDRPFPVDRGSAGDAFWLLDNALDIRYGLLSEAVAVYLAHPSHHGQLSLETWETRLRAAADRCKSNLARLLEDGPIPGGEGELLEQLIRSLVSQSEAEQALERMRQGRWGNAWFIRPGGWSARRARGHHRAEAERSRQAFLQAVLASGSAVTRTA